MSREAIDRLPPLRDVIAEHGLSAKKGLGQNFLLDLNLTQKIARQAGDLSGKTVLEIGPGPGGLTRALLRTEADKVVAIERDRRCIEALRPLAEAAEGRLQIVEADAIEVDEASLVPEGSHIAANLPYNIATPLLVKWMANWQYWSGFTLMFQKEVAERIIAPPGNKQYGRLAILAQWRCEARIAMHLPASAFTPPPKVASAVVSLYPRQAPLAPADPKILEKITTAAFSQRRKMIRASLKSLHPNVEAWLEAAGVSPTARAEELDIPTFCRLAESYKDS